jgi:gp16 family phage-associated protein
MRPTKTIEEARDWFDENGIAVSTWAKDQGFKRHTVVNLLRGRTTGRRGESHKAALALGIKKQKRASV